jgi:hypothetical protein
MRSLEAQGVTSPNPAGPEGTAESAALPAPPPNPNAPPVGVAEPALATDRSSGFVTAYFDNWSKANAEALVFAESIYAPFVTYYGRQVAVELVMREKHAFAERWPERSYKLRSGSVAVDCDSAHLVCTVTGLVDWICANPARRARASGTASFALKLSMLADGRIVITEENGKAIHEERTPG